MKQLTLNYPLKQLPSKKATSEKATSKKAISKTANILRKANPQLNTGTGKTLEMKIPNEKKYQPHII